MRPPAVVTIQQTLAIPPALPQILVSLSEPASANGKMPVIVPLDRSTLPPLLNANSLRDYGGKLRAALNSHPAVQAMLMGLDGNIPHNSNLVFQLLAPDLEDIRWETTAGGGGYLAVDTPAATCRIAGPLRTGGDVRIFAWPLTILAFISAAGISGSGELNELIVQVSAAQAAGFDVELDVCLGDQTLLVATQAAIAGGLQGVRASPMPTSPEALLDVVNDRQAEIVHFFCHGKSQGSQQFLELSTIVDTLTAAPRGSVQLPVFRLWTQPGAQAAWMIVLNCCDSAANPAAAGAVAVAQGPAIGSMAYRIVKEGGVPACVGMSEPIEYTDANLIARNLYHQLFQDLAPLATAISDTVVDFSAALIAPRQALRARHHANVGGREAGRWTLPTLYTTGAALRVQPLPNVAIQQRIQLRTVAKFLAALPQDTPPGVRAEALGLPQLAGIPESLRPDWLGRFERAPLSATQEDLVKRAADTLKTMFDAGIDGNVRIATRETMLAAVPMTAWPDPEGHPTLTHKDRVRIGVVADYLRKLSADANPALRAQALGYLDDIPPYQRPDAAGQLPVIL
ncbi:CHAT domain-containing protein [Phenylobacterium sp.]|uniref:CHAT domain-containing protein n=1 Tax=Phenylobacterium sp. TaxID=1871053 RepID=UPI0025F1FBFA|nr:CHAT domain-containing protein [Phenylobacterium sp.]MCA3586124.1 CHAT domain-containing protein [Methylocystis sp.]MCA6289123.1 CHAT domain-containing protein [Phenylobacterium sp.]MCA6345615.1 CHAT domain-containing protein [Phenylobacterium sp.]MCA6355286.1 CHAT domain-containing protein [Phenylobacterium sp.]MCA6358249.1 CHAT domain-containing protein [Phenylobacterium sp.]